jgi:hypothetical protein
MPALPLEPPHCAEAYSTDSCRRQKIPCFHRQVGWKAARLELPGAAGARKRAGGMGLVAGGVIRGHFATGNISGQVRFENESDSGVFFW